MAVKALCDGRTAIWKGNELVLRWGSYPVPLWMAAEGPRTQYLAGQIADGVVLSNALDADVLALARANLAAGAESVGRSIDDIEIWCMAAMCLADSEEEGIARLESQLAGTANHVYRFHTDGKGLPDEYRQAVATLMERYDSSVPRHTGASRGKCPAGARTGSGGLPGPPVGDRRSPATLRRADP